MISTIALIWYSLGWACLAIDYRTSPHDYDSRATATQCFAFAPLLIIAFIVAFIIYLPLGQLVEEVERSRHKQYWWRKE